MAQIVKGAEYRAWTGDTGPIEAETAFVARYGVRPNFVGHDQWGRNLLVGPVPVPEEGS